MQKAMALIKQHYSDYENIKLEKIYYGLEGAYLTISKLLIILVLAYFLNILEETLLLLFFFNIIRLPAFGMHASKSWICLVISSLWFLGVPLLLSYIELSNSSQIIICLLCTIIFYLYAPADTEKRPLINIIKRRNLKIISVSITIVLSILAINIDNIYISNMIIAAIIIESIMIMPITYKLFNQEYNNYRKYVLKPISIN